MVLRVGGRLVVGGAGLGAGLMPDQRVWWKRASIWEGVVEPPWLIHQLRREKREPALEWDKAERRVGERVRVAGREARRWSIARAK